MAHCATLLVILCLQRPGQARPWDQFRHTTPSYTLTGQPPLNLYALLCRMYFSCSPLSIAQCHLITALCIANNPRAQPNESSRPDTQNQIAECLVSLYSILCSIVEISARNTTTANPNKPGSKIILSKIYHFCKHTRAVLSGQHNSQPEYSCRLCFGQLKKPST